MNYKEKLESIVGKIEKKELPVVHNHTSLENFYQVRNTNKARQKNVYTYTFDKPVHKEQGLVVVPITDVHLGSRQSNVLYFEKFIDYILSQENCVTILNGDLAETATKISVGKAMFEESENFPDQLRILYDLLLPLAEQGKILGMGPGNHEERIANMIGINPMEILADKLNVPYFGYQGFFRVNVGDTQYKLAFHHGAGGGSTQGGKINASMKMNKVIGNADLYFSGHTHGKLWHEDVVFMMDDESDELVKQIRHYVVGGSFVEYWEGYPEMKALPPSNTGLVRCHLMPDQKEIRVAL